MTVFVLICILIIMDLIVVLLQLISKSERDIYKKIRITLNSCLVILFCYELIHHLFIK